MTIKVSYSDGFYDEGYTVQVGDFYAGSLGWEEVLALQKLIPGSTLELDSKAESARKADL